DRKLSPQATISLVIYTFNGTERIRQEISNPNSPTGRDTIYGALKGNHIFAVVEGDPEHNGEYALLCANGMVGSNPVGAANKQSLGIINDGVVIIQDGGSVCRDLNITWQEASELAQREGLKSYWEDGTFYVLIHPGDHFQKTGGIWHVIHPAAPATNVPDFPDL
ncbi:MAG TPA: hypothetical protein VJB09_00470, partial [Candidatus Paceibacterota bacterium]